MDSVHGIQFEAMEWGFVSTRTYAEPFNEIELDIVVTNEGGKEWKLPAFWAGDNDWRVRFAAPEPGRYRYESICSDSYNQGLHGRTGSIEIQPYVGSNPLLLHGKLQVAATGRTFEFEDGTPFLWLGDTWWYGLCKRLVWPHEFMELCDDRIRKGFNVIQMVAGMPCDAFEFDERAENEGGYVWERDYRQVNPAYFNMADLRIQRLVQCGLMPCILGSWGFYLPLMGAEKMKRHWRMLIARWSAYPVIWCVAGETTMVGYAKLFSGDFSDQPLQHKGWSDVARYIHTIEPYGRLITTHPEAFLNGNGRKELDDDRLVDFAMLQTGHGERNSVVENTQRVLRAAYAQAPTKPVINAEVCYEGHMQQNWQDVQRFLFWVCMLSGAAGHTYGAGGIWQLNARDKPFGVTPHLPPHVYENTPWDQAMRFLGSAHLGVGKSLLERYPWHRMEPHPEWVTVQSRERSKLFESLKEQGLEGLLPHPNLILQPYAAGISGELRMFYLPPRFYEWSGPLVAKMEKGIEYHACYLDPITGAEYELGTAVGDENGCWQAPEVPIMQDWVLVLSTVNV